MTTSFSIAQISRITIKGPHAVDGRVVRALQQDGVIVYAWTGTTLDVDGREAFRVIALLEQVLPPPRLTVVPLEPAYGSADARSWGVIAYSGQLQVASSEGRLTMRQAYRRAVRLLDEPSVEGLRVWREGRSCIVWYRDQGVVQPVRLRGRHLQDPDVFEAMARRATLVGE